jgi:hypothetical protein
VVYPIIYRVSSIQGDAGFLPSTVLSTWFSGNMGVLVTVSAHWVCPTKDCFHISASVGTDKTNACQFLWGKNGKKHQEHTHNSISPIVRISNGNT